MGCGSWVIRRLCICGRVKGILDGICLCVCVGLGCMYDGAGSFAFFKRWSISFLAFLAFFLRLLHVCSVR